MDSSTNRKLHLECVLSPQNEITATLSTVSDFSNIAAIEYPENARIYLLSEIDTPIEFEYDPANFPRGRA